MKNKLAKLALAALLWVLSIAASLSGTNTYTDYDMGETLLLDFGQARVNVIAHDKAAVRVSHTQRAAQLGLQGQLVATTASLTLTDYVAPTRQQNAVAYRVDPWLPLTQIDSYMEPFLGLPEADYTIHVPAGSAVDIRASSATAIGVALTGLSAHQALVTGCTLQDGFVADVVDLVVRGGSSEGSAYLESAYAVIRDFQAVDLTLHANAGADIMEIQMLDMRAGHVVIEATDRPTLNIKLIDVDFVSLSVGHSGPVVYSTLEKARIGQIYDNTATGLLGR